MAEAKYTFGKYSFYTREEYQASLRDALRFKQLKREGSCEEEIAYNYMRQLNEGAVHFESQLGADFYLRNESLCDAWERKNGLGVYYREKEKRQNRQERLLHFFSGFFLGVLLVSAVFFFLFLRNDKSSSEGLNELRSVNVYAAAADADDASPFGGSESLTAADDVPEVLRTAGTAHGGGTPGDIIPTELMMRNLSLSQKNPELAGWLFIAGTKIDYPVMQRIGDDSYYLSHDFYGNEDRNGLLVLDDDCDMEDMGLLIHGHNMRSGAMFAGLEDYRDPLYCATHDTIKLITMDEEREFKVFAVFEDHVDPDPENAFHFYRSINVNDIEEYEICVAGIKERALYDIELTPEYGSRLLMLSTCDYTRENGRLIVAAVAWDGMSDR